MKEVMAMKLSVILSGLLCLAAAVRVPVERSTNDSRWSPPAADRRSGEWVPVPLPGYRPSTSLLAPAAPSDRKLFLQPPPPNNQQLLQGGPPFPARPIPPDHAPLLPNPLFPADFQFPLAQMHLATAPERQVPPIPQPNENPYDEKEEVQLLYVPIETLQQRGRLLANNGRFPLVDQPVLLNPSIQKEMMHLLQEAQQQQQQQILEKQAQHQQAQQQQKHQQQNHFQQQEKQQQHHLHQHQQQQRQEQPLRFHTQENENIQRDHSSAFSGRQNPITAAPIQLSSPPTPTKLHQQKSVQPVIDDDHQQLQPKQENFKRQNEFPQTKLTPEENNFNQRLPGQYPTQHGRVVNKEASFNQADRKRVSSTQKPVPHQPPLSVFMGTKGENVHVMDVIHVLRETKTIAVLDSIGPKTPQVFVGPSNLSTPPGWVKFELPYLSSVESNRVERKVDQLPFFVAPLNFKPPPGYSKIPFPSPHVGSVIVSNSTGEIDHQSSEEESEEVLPHIQQTRQRPVNTYSLPAELPPINPELPTLVNSLQDARQQSDVRFVPRNQNSIASQPILQQTQYRDEYLEEIQTNEPKLTRQPSRNPTVTPLPQQLFVSTTQAPNRNVVREQPQVNVQTRPVDSQTQPQLIRNQPISTTQHTRVTDPPRFDKVAPVTQSEFRAPPSRDVFIPSREQNQFQPPTSIKNLPVNYFRPDTFSSSVESGETSEEELQLRHPVQVTNQPLPHFEERPASVQQTRVTPEQQTAFRVSTENPTTVHQRQRKPVFEEETTINFRPSHVDTAEKLINNYEEIPPSFKAHSTTPEPYIIQTTLSPKHLQEPQLGVQQQSSLNSQTRNHGRFQHQSNQEQRPLVEEQSSQEIYDSPRQRQKTHQQQIQEELLQQQRPAQPEFNKQRPNQQHPNEQRFNQHQVNQQPIPEKSFNQGNQAQFLNHQSHVLYEDRFPIPERGVQTQNPALKLDHTPGNEFLLNQNSDQSLNNQFLNIQQAEVPQNIPVSEQKESFVNPSDQDVNLEINQQNVYTTTQEPATVRTTTTTLAPRRGPNRGRHRANSYTTTSTTTQQTTRRPYTRNRRPTHSRSRTTTTTTENQVYTTEEVVAPESLSSEERHVSVTQKDTDFHNPNYSQETDKREQAFTAQNQNFQVDLSSPVLNPSHTQSESHINSPTSAGIREPVIQSDQGNYQTYYDQRTPQYTVNAPLQSEISNPKEYDTSQYENTKRPATRTRTRVRDRGYQTEQSINNQNNFDENSQVQQQIPVKYGSDRESQIPQIYISDSTVVTTPESRVPSSNLVEQSVLRPNKQYHLQPEIGINDGVNVYSQDPKYVVDQQPRIQQTVSSSTEYPNDQPQHITTKHVLQEHSQPDVSTQQFAINFQPTPTTEQPYVEVQQTTEHSLTPIPIYTEEPQTESRQLPPSTEGTTYRSSQPTRTRGRTYAQRQNNVRTNSRGRTSNAESNGESKRAPTQNYDTSTTRNFRGRTRNRQRVTHEPPEPENYPSSYTSQRSHIQQQNIHETPQFQKSSADVVTSTTSIPSTTEGEEFYGFIRPVETLLAANKQQAQLAVPEYNNNANRNHVSNKHSATNVYQSDNIDSFEDTRTESVTTNYRKHPNFISRGTARRPTRPHTTSASPLTTEPTTVQSDKVYTVRPSRRPTQQTKITRVRGRIRKPTTSTTTTSTTALPERLPTYPTTEPTFNYQQVPVQRYNPSAIANEVADGYANADTQDTVQRYNEPEQGVLQVKSSRKQAHNTEHSDLRDIPVHHKSKSQNIPEPYYDDSPYSQESDDAIPYRTQSQPRYQESYQQSQQPLYQQRIIPSEDHGRYQYDDPESVAESQWSSKYQFNRHPNQLKESNQDKNQVTELPQTSETKEIQTEFSQINNKTMSSTLNETETPFHYEPVADNSEDLKKDENKNENELQVAVTVTELPEIPSTISTVITTLDKISENQTPPTHTTQATEAIKEESNSTNHNDEKQDVHISRRGGWIRTGTQQAMPDLLETAESQNVATLGNNILFNTATKQADSYNPVPTKFSTGFGFDEISELAHQEQPESYPSEQSEVSSSETKLSDDQDTQYHYFDAVTFLEHINDKNKEDETVLGEVTTPINVGSLEVEQTTKFQEQIETTTGKVLTSDYVEPIILNEPAKELSVPNGILDTTSENDTLTNNTSSIIDKTENEDESEIISPELHDEETSASFDSKKQIEDSEGFNSARSEFDNVDAGVDTSSLPPNNPDGSYEPTTETPTVSTQQTERRFFENLIFRSQLPKVLGTSTSTEISHETEICYRGKCVKTKTPNIEKIQTV